MGRKWEGNGKEIGRKIEGNGKPKRLEQKMMVYSMLIENQRIFMYIVLLKS